MQKRDAERLIEILQEYLRDDLKWVVFEPNAEPLWGRVRQSVTAYLHAQWREGALRGEKEEEAFSVAVGRDSMTEDDILNGRLIVEIGIAPVKPAEFVIFRIFKRTAEARV